MSSNHIHNLIANNQIDRINFYKNPIARRAIARRDGCRCIYCGCFAVFGDFTLEHLCPQSKGGGHGHKNLVLCCKSCNSARGNRPMMAFALSRGLTPTELINRLHARLTADIVPHLHAALIVARPDRARQIGLVA